MAIPEHRIGKQKNLWLYYNSPLISIFFVLFFTTFLSLFILQSILRIIFNAIFIILKRFLFRLWYMSFTKRTEYSSAQELLMNCTYSTYSTCTQHMQWTLCEKKLCERIGTNTLLLYPIRNKLLKFLFTDKFLFITMINNSFRRIFLRLIRLT